MQAILPVLREMGMAQGHVRQGSLEARLNLIAAAPWKAARTPAQTQALLPASSAKAGAAAQGKADGNSAPAAEGQATALLNFAWGFVFEAPTGSLHFLDIR